ncbi:hypothetical protein SAMN02745166_01191 [Prosthecobacter debontii]|uniref:Nucleotidyltransferase domain-containing protein n=1 Tax=Prosthecobacter debontii TaxID=48467 RepID=A0A1T4X8C8_9BACT|nr:nucleotidyltransferase [Prosthecobacter debontii]SKA85709.1 hypothetical protein SAMN02745166_01191 [Prosthecobacter debontii]
MSNHAYLKQLLAEQDLRPEEVETLQRCGRAIQRAVARLDGNPRFYYAGSFGKQTIIRENFDLDIVAYWPDDCGYTLKGIFDAVGKVLQNEWKSARSKGVAWTISFKGGFHIDVVPGRALDKTFREANLYRNDKDSSMKTSIKVHIETVKKSGRRDAIRLMKLWRTRNNVPVKKSLILELLTIRALEGTTSPDLEHQLLTVFSHLRENIEVCRIVDPANSNNVVSDELTARDRSAIRTAASAAIAAGRWSEVF